MRALMKIGGTGSFLQNAWWSKKNTKDSAPSSTKLMRIINKKCTLSGSILLCEVFGPRNLNRDSKIIKGKAIIEIKNGPCKISRRATHRFIFNWLPFITIPTK